jgi:hypothetical protein
MFRNKEGISLYPPLKDGQDLDWILEREEKQHENSSHQTPPPPHQAGVATLQEVANPPLVAGGEGCGLPPGHRSQTRTWPPGRPDAGRPDANRPDAGASGPPFAKKAART